MKLFGPILLIAFTTQLMAQDIIEPEPIPCIVEVADSLVTANYEPQGNVQLDFLWIGDHDTCENSYLLLIKKDDHWIGYGIGEASVLRFEDWSYKTHQLNDGQEEMIVSFSQGYGKGYCGDSWYTQEETLFILDLDRLEILLTVETSYHHESWHYPNGCDTEEEIDEELTEEAEEGLEEEVLVESTDIENTVYFENGQVIIVNEAYHSEDCGDIPIGNWVWNGTALEKQRDK